MGGIIAQTSSMSAPHANFSNGNDFERNKKKVVGGYPSTLHSLHTAGKHPSFKGRQARRAASKTEANQSAFFLLYRAALSLLKYFVR